MMSTEVGPSPPATGTGSAGAGSGTTSVPPATNAADTSSPKPVRSIRPGFAGAPSSSNTVSASGSKTAQPPLSLSDEEKGDLRFGAYKIILASRLIYKNSASKSSQPQGLQRYEPAFEPMRDLDGVAKKIMETRLGRSPADADVEQLYDNVAAPYLSTLKLDQQYQATQSFENYRDQTVFDSLYGLNKFTNGNAIDPAHKQEVEKVLANARHWIGRHTSESDSETKENQESRLRRALIGLNPPLVALFVEKLEDDARDGSHVTISPDDVHRISYEHFVKEPNNP
jgi:hypothetical protein